MVAVVIFTQSTYASCTQTESCIDLTWSYTQECDGTVQEEPETLPCDSADEECVVCAEGDIGEAEAVRPLQQEYG